MDQTKSQFNVLSHAIDLESGMPRYMQLAQAIQRLIETQIARAGDQLPNTIDMAKLAGVDIGTVGKAMGLLVDQNLVVRRRRAGTFVAPDAIPKRSSIGFYYLRGRQPLTLKTVEAMHERLDEKLLDIKLIPFDPEFFSKVNMVEDIRSRSLKAAMITTVDTPECLNALQLLEQADIPHLRLDNRYFDDQLSSPLLTENHEKAMADSINLLRDQGHKAIGFMGCHFSDQRDQVYQQMMSNVKGYRDSWRLDTRQWVGIGEPLPMGDQIARGYLHENPELTAVIAYHPMEVKAIVQQAALLNRPVPQKLSVIGLRDWGELGVDMAASSWRVPIDNLADTAVDLLIHLVGDKTVARRTEIDFVLVDRSTVSNVN